MNCYDLVRNKKGGIGGCIIGFAVTLVVIGAIVGGLFGYVYNTTPAKLKVADIEFMDGVSLRSLGFADMKIKDIIKQFKSLVNADTSEIVRNAPADEDKTNAESNLEGATNEGFTDGSGTPDYTFIVSNQLTYENRSVKLYEDTTLAYIFNMIVSQSVDSAASADSGNEGSQGIEYLKKINASVNEITITKTAGDAKMRIVMSVNTAELKEKITEALGAAAGIVRIPIPDVLYAVAYFGLTADSEKPSEIAAVSEDLRINDTDNAVSKAIFKLLATQAGLNSDDEAAQKAAINDKIGNAFKSIIFNLGDLGTAVTDEQGLVTGEITLGATGILNGNLSIITRTA